MFEVVSDDVGEQLRLGGADDAEEAHRHGGVELGPVAAQHRYGVFDAGSFVLGQL